MGEGPCTCLFIIIIFLHTLVKAAVKKRTYTGWVCKCSLSRLCPGVRGRSGAGKKMDTGVVEEKMSGVMSS